MQNDDPYADPDGGGRTNLVVGNWIPMLGNESGTELSVLDTNELPAAFSRTHATRD